MKNLKDCKVALLVNFIPPYRIPLYTEIAKYVKELKIFISTYMEKNRNWKVEYKDLNVFKQKCITIDRTHKHPHGFTDEIYIHIPYNTIKELEEYSPDIIISGEMGLRSILSMIYKIFHKNTKYILWATLSEYSELGRGLLRNIIRKWLIPKANAILVNGNSGKRYIKKFRVSDERLFFTPYTTDISKMLGLPLEKDSKQARRMLIVSQLIERKGLFQFFNALNNWGINNRDKNIELLIVGDGILREKLENFIFPDNISVKFVGSVPYEEVINYYKESGIFVFPTLSDEWGLVVNEAMACGLVILGSIYSQAVEELVGSENGFTFRPDCEDEIINAISQIMTLTEEELNIIRKKNREKISSLTPEYVAANVAKAMEFVINKF
ncbi:MAG TPA: glycosyltransferase family 4 protein [Spirochaetota bacterium]|nr:glycosyltransferase family 4 protein [Spirochaetota bacterium]HPP05314.1 glycosyltransferase family 4 protein [Spirochaetota bacterium]